MAGTHTFEEHVGEVRMRLAAPSLPELFAEAARGLAELVCGSSPPALGATRRVSLHARDREALLVALLDELVFRAEVEDRVFPEVDVVLRNDRELDATLRCAEGVSPRLHVKAATLHGLAISDTPDGVAATVVLDV